MHPRLGLRLGAGLAQLGDDAREHVLRVAHDRHVDRLVLADLGRVDVDVDDLGLARERRELAGHPVVEAHADGDEQVGLGDRVVRVLRAVHARHADPQVVVLGERALAHHRGGDRELHELGELLELLGRAARDARRRPRRAAACAPCEISETACLICLRGP